jgi:hypothetical protein
LSPKSRSSSSLAAQQSAKSKKRKVVNIIVFGFVFTIAWLPLVLSVAGTGAVDSLAFSLYNPYDYPGNGCSRLREVLESTAVQIHGENRQLEVMPLISSLSVVDGINTNSVLCVLGPSSPFSIIETSSLIDFFDRGCCMVIADDFGSGNQILDYLALMIPNFPSQFILVSKVSGIRFDNRLLLDSSSNDGGKPLLPTITSFTGPGGTIFPNTHRVVMNYATGITGVSQNFTPLAMSSTNSWLTSDWNNPAYDPNRPDAYGGDKSGPFTLVGMMGIGKGILVLISDPSLFINDMIIRGDNAVFAQELFTFLAQHSNTSNVIFDHHHLNWPPSAPVLYVGLMLGQVTYVSANWLLAPLAPLLVLWMVRRYLPSTRPEKTAPREIYRLRGQTLFTKTLYDYIHNQRYDEAIRIVYGRLKRDLVRRHSLRAFDVPQLIATVSRTRQPPDLAVLNADFQALEEATRQPRRIDRDKFLDLFFKITRIRENIG